MEQSGWPGNIGDSCAETSRLYILLNWQRPKDLTKLFKTELGWVRHPEAPVGWREDDFSGDQALPLLLAGSGNYKLMFKNAGCFAAYVKAYTLLEIITFVQAVLFSVPLRWNDGTRSFETGENSSADYLNFCMCMLVLSRKGFKMSLIKKLVPAERLKGKIASYYVVEPNSQWLGKLYFDQIEEMYK